MKSALQKHATVSRTIAFDSENLWNVTNDGAFSRTPWRYILTTYESKDGLVIAANKAVFYFVPWTVLPNPQDRGELIKLLKSIGKLGKTSIFSFGKQK